MSYLKNCSRAYPDHSPQHSPHTSLGHFKFTCMQIKITNCYRFDFWCVFRSAGKFFFFFFFLSKIHLDFYEKSCS